ncbi:MAG: hypothetical protein ABJE47_24185 [bacterium]
MTPAGAGFTASVTVHSGADGRWRATIPTRAAEYYLTVSAIGWIQYRTTIHSKNDGSSLLVVPDIPLERVAVSLNAVRVTATRRQPPAREGLGSTDVAQTEKGLLASSEVFAAADQGDLLAMIAQVPGVTLTSDPSSTVPQFSVLGLSGSQNNVTLNGMVYGGTDVPRDIIGAIRVNASPYDVSRGGFSGAQLSITQAAGTNYVDQLVHATLDAPALQVTDRIGRQIGQPYTNVQLSGGLSGPLVDDRLFYNVSVQGGRRYSDLPSLLSGDAATLAAIGVSRDSVTALTAAAATRGIPLFPSGIPHRRLTNNVSALSRFDWTPSRGAQVNVTSSLRHTNSVASFISSTALPVHGGELTHNGGDVTAELSAYIDSLVLSDTRIGYHSDITKGSPYSRLPDARVFVTSNLDDGSTGLASLLFGGNATLPRYTRTSGAELFHQASWNSSSNSHRWRLTADGRIDELAQTQGGNSLGTFTYNSIADVQANRPTSFSRSFAQHDILAKVNTGALALGDEWRATQRLSITYGVRLDANAIANSLAYNPTIDSTFHLRTDHAPSEAVVSPRASFRWGFGSNGTAGLPGFAAPWGVLSGGIGEFRNDLRPGLLAPVVTNTGLPDALGQILCIGSAVPLPDFAAFEANLSAIPTTCVAGAPSAFVSARPNVWAFDPNFEAQRSWRGNLTLRGPFFTKLLRFSADATFSRNLHQQSPLDVNFSGVQRSALRDEGNRPLYVQSASIVPATGAVTNGDSRVSQGYGSVNDVRSDLASRTAQYTFALNPIGVGVTFLRWSVSYVYTDVREEARGFDGSTAGDPSAVDWSRGSITSKHAVNINVFTRVQDWLSIALTGRAASGRPFTPMVDGDMNGDGLSNDRAFIFSPTSSNAAIAEGMSQLIGNASSRTRKCLLAQVGTIAGRNSCEGPWTATTAASITLNPRKLGWDNRTTLSLNLANPLAGFDELVHGSGRMHGWGQPALPDVTLLRVHGYDPAANAFLYEVNQRFGDTHFGSSLGRVPFVVTLEARVRLGSDDEHQQLNSIVGQGRARRGDERSPQQIRAQLAGSVFNPLRSILQAKDSLTILSQQQIDRLTQLQRRLAAKQDSIWGPVVAYLSSLPESYNLDEAVEHVRPARTAAFDAVVEAVTQALKILTPEQIADLPPFLRSSFDLESLEAFRPTKGFSLP